MLLSEWMIVVSERCTDLINEFETHHWMWNWTDKVEKTDDDALDALRYFIFSYLWNITLRDMQKDIKRLQSTKTKRVDRY
jgi:phage terminase large subunit